MARVGDRFKTGQRCETAGIYAFDGYADNVLHPPPTEEERVIPMREGGEFPPIRSRSASAWWKLQRIT